MTDRRDIASMPARRPKYRPLVVCDETASLVVERAGLEAMAWSDFLLHGPPGVTTGAAHDD